MIWRLATLSLAALSLIAAATAQAEPPDREPALDVSLGGGLIVPVNVSGTVEYASLGLATFLDAHNAIGLRAAMAPAPLPASGGAGSSAWAALLDYRAFLGRSDRLDPFFAASVGYAAADRSAEGRDNLALPAVQIGAGLELGWSLPGGGALFVAPQLGFVPGVFYGDGPFSVAAPVADVRIGARSAPRSALRARR